jgi:hypothetical protein
MAGCGGCTAGCEGSRLASVTTHWAKYMHQAVLRWLLWTSASMVRSIAMSGCGAWSVVTFVASIKFENN